MSTYTSDVKRACGVTPSGSGTRGNEEGLSLIEVLLGLSLALTLALGIAPVWISFQSLGVREGDETIWTLQGRVAGARLERDTRLAGPAHCPFGTAASVLQATPSQVVLLVSASGSAPPLLVEWELVSGSLMRRWGACPAVRPTTFSHSLYSDSKTMLENVDTSRSRFSYRVAGREAAAPVDTADLSLVDGLTLDLCARPAGVTGTPTITVSGRVAR